MPRKVLMTKKLLIASLLVVSTGLVACATYSSRPYAPNSSADQEVYVKARKNIYPQQVKQDPARYSNETIAWAGIVKKVELFQSDYGPAVSVLIEHRYFDWIEDHGAQPEVFFLSPRGEGEFMIIVKPEKQVEEKEISRLIPVGTMVIAVGKIYVKAAQDKTRPLALLTQYFQFIDRKWYRTDVFDYGRENEPMKKVQGGEYWKKYGPN
jgi:hypothetical protein